MNDTAEAQAKRVILWWRLTTPRDRISIIDAMKQVLGGGEHEVWSPHDSKVFDLVYDWKYHYRPHRG